MIIVTGGAGFIGSNLIRMINLEIGNDVICVDNFMSGNPLNLSNTYVSDLINPDYLPTLLSNKNHNIECIVHLGACTDTMERDPRVFFKDYEMSKALLNYSINNNVGFIYASSAAVYGNRITNFTERSEETPINEYAYFKALFDQKVKSLAIVNKKIIGLRFFNVYGPNEQYKGKMSSVIFQMFNTLSKNGKIKLFDGSSSFHRDFIYVDDVCRLIIFLINMKVGMKEIFNVGTGNARSFEDVANIIIGNSMGKIEYIKFPQELEGHYQVYTRADLTIQESCGVRIKEDDSLEIGIQKYREWFTKQY